MKTKRYQVEGQTQGSDIWEPICHTDDLSTAKGYAGAVLRSEKIRAIRVVDQKTGQVWLVKPDVHNTADAGL